MSVVYEAVRGDERICGSIDEIAAAVGKTPKYIHKMLAGIRGARNAWKVHRLYRTAWEYAAENPDDDPVSGSLEEVSAILGYTERYVRHLANTGRVSRGGWRVRKRLVRVDCDERDV